MKPAELRPLAEDDLIAQTQHYRSAGGPELAARFFDAAIDALRSVEMAPGIGSPRIGELIGAPQIRRAAVAGFPCSWLYLEGVDALDVVRLVGDRQDIAVLLEIEAEGGVHPAEIPRDL